jgi:hypothetical protein
MIIAIDSDSEESTTKKRDEIFENHGFSRQSPHKNIPLPESTYMGKVSSPEAGKDKVKQIWTDLKAAHLEPRKICGGIIDDWKVIRSNKDID